MDDWFVEFTDPGANAPKVPWQVNRVESSGVIFLKDVAERVRERRRRETEAQKPTLVKMPDSRAMRPVEETSSRVPIWAVAGFVVVLVGGLALLAGHQWSSRSASAAVANMDTASTGPVATAPQVVTATAPSVTPKVPQQLQPEPVQTPRAAVVPVAKDRDPEPKAEPKAAPTRQAHVKTASSGKHHETVSERRRRKRREAREKKEDDSNAEAKALPSLQDSLKQLAPHKAAAAQPATPAPRPRPAATPMDSKLNLLVKASAREKKAATKPAVELPKRLSAAVLLRHARSLMGRARACLKRFGIVYQTLQLHLSISGSTGRVVAARIQGSHHGTPAGRCVERAGRSLRFPKFKAARQGITVPIR